jgi:predicted Zn finger-like uncharacterized protein
MIVTCNECESSFNVDDSLIKADGSKVRCSKCSSVFVVYPDISDAEIGEDADDFSPEMDEDLGADLDSDEEIDDLAIESSAGDELPELDDMVDFDDDESAIAEVAEEASGELELDFDLDEDEDEEVAEKGTLDEEELDLDLEEESVAEADETELGQVEAVDSDLADIEMDLDDSDQAEEADMVAEESDLDLNLELDDEKAAAAAAQGPAAQDESDALDLSDLEDLVDSDADMDLEDVTVEASDDADLDLDAEEMEPIATEEVAEQDESDTLDLSDLEDLVDSDADMDLEDVTVEAPDDADLDLDAEEMEPIATEEVAAQDESDALDLSDLEDLVDSDVDMELEGEALEASDDTDLDLSDLDDILDTEEEPAEADLSAEDSDDLDLDLDLEAEPTAEEPILESSADLDGVDELDLSDLDGLMESDETPAEAAAVGEVAEDLELDFEVDEDAAETAAVETAETPDQLDIPDLEKMLESDEAPTSESTEELDLDLDLDLETEGAVEASTSPAEQTASDDAEFLDIEKMLEESEDTASAQPGAEEPLELDLEAVMDEAAQSKEPELELNLDLGDDMVETESVLDISESGEEDLEFNLLGSDEETLQFGATQASATQIDEGLTAGGDLDASDDDFASDDFAATHDVHGDTDVMDQSGARISAPVKKGRTRKPVLVALLLLVLCLVGYVVIQTQNLGIKIPYVSDIKIPFLSDLKIPYLSGLLKSEDQDMVGNLKIMPMGKTITHKFIENTSAGDIFVIAGQVRNEYDHPRSYIKITGKLYRKGKALVNTATVYGGNTLSDSDLARLDMPAINKRLQNRFGDNRSNIKVKTGKTIPFLIIFGKLPDNLDEYTVEVSGSSS